MNSIQPTSNRVVVVDAPDIERTPDVRRSARSRLVVVEPVVVVSRVVVCREREWK